MEIRKNGCFFYLKNNISKLFGERERSISRVCIIFPNIPHYSRLAQADFPCVAREERAHLTSVKSQWRDAKRIVSRRVESREGQAPE